MISMSKKMLIGKVKDVHFYAACKCWGISQRMSTDRLAFLVLSFGLDAYVSHWPVPQQHS